MTNMYKYFKQGLKLLNTRVPFDLGVGVLTPEIG